MPWGWVGVVGCGRAWRGGGRLGPRARASVGGRLRGALTGRAGGGPRSRLGCGRSAGMKEGRVGVARCVCGCECGWSMGGGGHGGVIQREATVHSAASYTTACRTKAQSSTTHHTSVQHSTAQVSATSHVTHPVCGVHLGSCVDQQLGNVQQASLHSQVQRRGAVPVGGLEAGAAPGI